MLLMLLVCLCPSTLLVAQDEKGPNDKEDVPEWVLDGLLSALDDPEPGVAEFVPLLADAMSRHFDFAATDHKKKSTSLAKRLAEFCTHRDRDVRSSAAEALGLLGLAAAEQAPTLVELLKD
jgi:hypothetical protein